jgi:hypothetical protein
LAQEVKKITENKQKKLLTFVAILLISRSYTTDIRGNAKEIKITAKRFYHSGDS